MASWVSVFSKFTPEALLFESLAICALFAGYCAFWVLRKRRLGAVGPEVPAGVVKVYLNELIQDAEQMRAQLFGLLRSAGVDVGPAAHAGGPHVAAAPAAATVIHASDPAIAQKLLEMEARMGEQAKAMQALVIEKQKIEKELADARSATTGTAAGAPAGDGSAALSQMQEKISLLEGKLAEYSVIEDDLANLKKLQQENAQLRAALQGKGADAKPAETPAPAPPPAQAAETPAAPAAPAAAPAATAPKPEAPAAEAAAGPAPLDGEISAEAALAGVGGAPEAAAAAAPAAPAAGSDAFEALVDQVEQSLAPEAPAAAPAAAPETAPSAPSEAAAPTPDAAPKNAPEAAEKSDADLVAEFEKMLRP